MATNHRRRIGTLGLVLVILAFVAAAAAATEEEGCQGKFSHQIAGPESYGQNNNRRRLGKRPLYGTQFPRQQEEAYMDNNVEEASTVELRFTCNTLKTPIYTHKTISACDGQPVDVAICRDGRVIESGPLSSLNVEIVALPGDFRQEDNPTEEDFDRRIAVSRDGQGSVLEGLRSRALLNGRRSFDGIRFKEGSSRTSRRQFTLAARVVRGQDIGGLIRVHEAFMAPVNVKDRRSEANEKSDRPELNDEVYRLKGIAKNGPYFKRLQEKSIRTVQDFLKLYNTYPERLRNILEIKSHRSRSWETMTTHALDCDLGDMHMLKKYTIAGGHVAVFFNCVHDLVGAEFYGDYVAKEKFREAQKAFVDGLKEQAYNELEGIQLDYVMEDGRPIHISTSINVGLPPFPMQHLYPPDQHATYQAVDNSGPAEINQHMPQTHPNQANCNIAAPDPGAGGSEWATCPHSMPVSAALGTSSSENFSPSDFLNKAMFTPSPTYGDYQPDTLMKCKGKMYEVTPVRDKGKAPREDLPPEDTDFNAECSKGRESPSPQPDMP